MQAYKEVALRLHSLHGEDRVWMLGQMAPKDRATVEPLLEELQALGIPKQLTERVPRSPALESEVDEPEVTEVQDDLDEYISIIDGADIKKLKALARTEPPEVFGVLMSLHSWNWVEPVLYGLADSAATNLRQIANRVEGRVAEGFKQSILESFAELIGDMDLSEIEADSESELKGRSGGWKDSLRRLMWRR